MAATTARAVQAPPLPASVEDLTRDGLLYLIRRQLLPSGWDLLNARHHELKVAADAAFEAWRASAPAAHAAMEQYHQLLRDGASASTLAGAKALLAAREAHEVAEQKRDRQFRAYRRAEAAADACWRALMGEAAE